MAKPKLVIFCGAGFSTCADIPVMSQFTTRLRSSGFLLDHEQVEFDQIQLECEAMGMLIGANARNLEQLSSFLSILSLTQPNFFFRGCDDYARPEEAIELVNRCIRHLVRYEITTQQIGPSAGIFEAAKYADITFVTTNYDLVIEMAANVAISSTSPSERVYAATKSGQSPGLHARNERLYHKDGDQRFSGPVSIFKLHGSANWFVRGDTLQVFDTLKPVGGIDRVRQIDYADLTKDAKCLIVPPTVLKPRFDNLADQWSGASEAISKADMVWFIGYSFPESDSFMRYFLASALSSNAAINQLVVIDPDRNVRERALSIFRAPSLESVFHFLPVKWTDMDREQLAKGNVGGAIGQGMINVLAERTHHKQILDGK